MSHGTWQQRGKPPSPSACTTGSATLLAMLGGPMVGDQPLSWQCNPAATGHAWWPNGGRSTVVRRVQVRLQASVHHTNTSTPPCPPTFKLPVSPLVVAFATRTGIDGTPLPALGSDPRKSCLHHHFHHRCHSRFAHLLAPEPPFNHVCAAHAFEPLRCRRCSHWHWQGPPPLPAPPGPLPTSGFKFPRCFVATAAPFDCTGTGCAKPPSHRGTQSRLQ